MSLMRVVKFCASVTLAMCVCKVAVAQDVGLALTRLLGQERYALGEINDAKVAELAAKPSASDFMFDPKWLGEQPAAKGDEHWSCLTQALYFEARGEALEGQFAVAEVILNRVDAVEFPDTVCRVVNQGTGRRFACQFTFTCDGRAETVGNRKAWTRAGKIARIMLDGAPRALTSGATYYHTLAVSPRWSKIFSRTATIGMHHFYRPQTQLTEG